MLQITLFIAFVAFITLVVFFTSKVIGFLTSKINVRKQITDVVLVIPIALSIIITIIFKVPAYMPVVTFENDNGQQLVFIGMQHVGSKNYYEQVNDRVVSLRKLGYVVLHEGVGMNGDVSVSLRSCSKVNEKESPTGLVNQPGCIGELHPGDKYADLSKSDFLALYSEHLERLGVSDDDAKQTAKNKSKNISDKNEEIKSSFIKYIGLKLAISHKSLQYFFSKDWDDNETDSPVILGERNKVVVNYVTSEKNTVTAYGLAHMAGVKNRLLKEDPSWRIVSVDAIKSL